MRDDALFPAPDALPDPLGPWARLMLLIGTCLTGIVVGGLVGLGLSCLIWGVDFTTASFVSATPANYPFARGFVLLSNSVAHLLALTVGPIILLRATLPGSWWRTWRHTRLGAPGPALGLLGAGALLIISIPAMTWVIDWNAHLVPPPWLAPLTDWMRASEEKLRAITELLTRQRTGLDLFTALLGIAVLPALGEELTFRGILQPTVARLFGGSTTAGIWVAAVVFSAIHVQFFGFVPRMLLGAGFGYLYAWSGRLWVPMVAHLTNNGLQLVLLYFYQHGMLPLDPANDAPAPWPWMLASVLLTLAGGWALRRYLLAHATPLLTVPALRPGQYVSADASFRD